MALITDKPEDLDSTNELDKIDDDLLSVPPAYYSLGSTPQPMDNPPRIDETRTLVVRVKCTGQGEAVRTDGEHRFTRKFEILACWEKGQPEPPDPDADQGSLFDEDGDDDG